MIMSVLRIIRRIIFSRILAHILWFVAATALIFSLTVVAMPIFVDIKPLLNWQIGVAVLLLCLNLWAQVKVWKRTSAKTPADKKKKAAAVDQTDAMMLKLSEQHLEGGFHHLLSNLDRIGYSRTKLYSFPWYMMVGPPDAGKSSSLQNSGVVFAKQGAKVDGFSSYLQNDDGTVSKDGSGTKFEAVEWWLADNCLFIDPKGTYLTEGGQSALSKRMWRHLIKLLCRARENKPLDGVIVTYSLEQLLFGDPDQNLGNCIAIREHLRELNQLSGSNVPIYIMMTKIDKIPGFLDSASDLSPDERQAVFGIPLIDGNDDWQDAFYNGFDSLSKMFERRICKLLMAESDLKDRQAQMSFVASWPKLRDSLFDFLQNCFQDSRFEETFSLQGLYFTCSEQDRSYGNHSQKSAYFLSHLFGRHFPGRLFQANRIFQSFPRKVLFAASFVGICAVGGLLHQYYATTKTLGHIKHSFEENVGLAEALESGPVANLSAKIDVLGRYHSLYSFPKLLGYGPLYFVNVYHLSGNVADAYVSLVRNEFEPFLKKSLINDLRRAEGKKSYQDLIVLQAALKSATTIKGNRSALVEWFEGYLGEHYKLDLAGETARSQLQHLSSFLDSGRVLELNGEERRLSGRVNGLMDAFPDYKKVVLRMVQEAAEGYGHLDLSPILGAQSCLVAKNPRHTRIQHLYTESGYRNFYLDKRSDFLEAEISRQENLKEIQYESKERAQILARLQREVDGFYAKEFQNAWIRLWSGLHVKKLKTFHEAFECTRRFTQQGDSFAALVNMTNSNVNFPYYGLQHKLTQSAHSRKYGIHRLVSRDELAETIARPFGGFRLYLEEEGELSQSFADLDGALLAVSTIVSEAENHPSVGENAFEKAKLIATGQLGEIAKLRSFIGRQKSFVIKRSLGKYLNQLESVFQIAAKQYLTQEWVDFVKNEFDDTYRSRFPFTNTKAEISAGDFAHLFAPKGVLDSFFEKYLSPFLRKTRGGYRWRHEVIRFNSDIIQFYDLASSIRDGMFKGESSDLLSEFLVGIDYISPSIGRVEFESSNSKYAYSHGPFISREFKWSAGQDLSHATLTIYDRDKRATEWCRRQGKWSLFRLFAASDIRSKRRDIDVVHFEKEDLVVDLTIQGENHRESPAAIYRKISSLEVPGWI